MPFLIRRAARLISASAFGFSAFFFHVTTDAAEDPIAILSVTEPPASTGIDAAALRKVAEDEIRLLDRSQLKRKTGLSLAVVATSDASCVVNATVQDRRRGNILGIAVGESHAPETTNVDQRAAMAKNALRNAITRVPAVIAASN